MKQFFPKYEFPIHGVAWTESHLPVAGIFFLDGECHVVAQGGPAERELVERGALRVASVRFDREATEAGHAGRPLRALDARDVLARFALAERN